MSTFNIQNTLLSSRINLRMTEPNLEETMVWWGRMTIMYEQHKNRGCGSTFQGLLPLVKVGREAFLRKGKSKPRPEGQVRVSQAKRSMGRCSRQSLFWKMEVLGFWTYRKCGQERCSIQKFFLRKNPALPLPGFRRYLFHLAISCEPLESPVHGSMDCSPSLRTFQYDTNCSFRCAEGFMLRGADIVRCDNLGQWTAPAPVCQGTVTVVTFFCVSQLIRGISICTEHWHAFLYQIFTENLLCAVSFVLGTRDEMKWWAKSVLGTTCPL